MKVFFAVTVITLLLSIHGNCQVLKKEILTEDDRRNGVSFKFSYSENDSYGVIKLVLKKDSTFSYSLNTIAINGISEGKWAMFKNVLVLESTLQKDNIPIEISCNDNRRFVDTSCVAVVENSKHKLLQDAFVLVNEDSIKCLPMIGRCTGTFEKIYRVKVVFENGMSSNWTPLSGDRSKIAITVLTDVSISRYIVMNRQRFILKGKCLEWE